MSATVTTEEIPSVTPYLTIRNAAHAIEFYQKAFGAIELDRVCVQGGTSLLRATLKIGNALIMVADEFLDWGAKSPSVLGGSPVVIYLYVDNADSTFRKAVQAGATVTLPLQPTPWGDRYGKLIDPFGHHWAIATRPVRTT